MAGTNGTDILIQIDDGASGWDVVGMQQDGSVEETTEFVDFSSKDGRETVGEPGRYSSTGSFDSVWLPSDAAFITLQDAMRNGTKVLLQKTNAGTAFSEASCVITSLSRTEPDQGPSIVSMTFQVDGPWIPRP